MSSNFTRFLILSLFSFAAACSEQKVKEDVSTPPAYVTNAEYVLEALKSNKTSAVAFQVKPVRSTACEHMYIEFGQKNSEGQWEVTNAIFPGKDPRDNFGQDALNDQIHFAEFDGSGDSAVIALGCKPYGGDIKVVKGLLATFNIEYGKLNYIGELAQIPVTGRFSKFEVSDRTSFALEQIKSQFPQMETYFHASLMQKYEIELSDERKVELAKLNRKVQKLRKIAEAQKKVIEERNSLRDEITLWEESKGYPEKALTKKLKIERGKMVRVLVHLDRTADLYDKFVKEDRPLSYIENYLTLFDNINKHWIAYKDKYPELSLTVDRTVDPEKERLSDNHSKAKDALRAFQEDNP